MKLHQVVLSVIALLTAAPLVSAGVLAEGDLIVLEHLSYSSAIKDAFDGDIPIWRSESDEVRAVNLLLDGTHVAYGDIVKDGTTCFVPSGTKAKILRIDENPSGQSIWIRVVDGRFPGCEGLLGGVRITPSR